MPDYNASITALQGMNTFATWLPIAGILVTILAALCVYELLYRRNWRRFFMGIALEISGAWLYFLTTLTASEAASGNFWLLYGVAALIGAFLALIGAFFLGLGAEKAIKRIPKGPGRKTAPNGGKRGMEG